MDRKKSLAVASALGAMLCYSTIPGFLRYLLRPVSENGMGLDPWNVNAARYLTAALFWLPFVLILSRRRRTMREAARQAVAGATAPTTALAARRVGRGAGRGAGRGVWLAAFIPALVNVAGQITWGVVGKYVEASIIGFGTKLAFLFTVLFGFLFFRDERRLASIGSFWAGTVACVAGLSLMSLPSLHGGGAASALGLGLLLAVTLFWGLYSVVVKRHMAAFPPVLSFGVISLYTTAVLVVLMFIFGRPVQLLTMDLHSWGLIIASGLLGIAFAHVLLYTAIFRLGAVVASGIPLISPFFTLLVSVLFLGERRSAVETVGGVVIIAGGLLLILARERLDRREAIAAGEARAAAHRT